MNEDFLDQVYAIEIESFRYPYPKHLLRHFLALFPDFFLIALHGEKVTGYIVGAIRRRVLGHIISLAVKKEYRRKGIAWRLLEKLEDQFRKNGVKIFRLEVEATNDAAVSLYLRRGFKMAYVIPNYYPGGEPCVVMFKKA